MSAFAFKQIVTGSRNGYFNKLGSPSQRATKPVVPARRIVFPSTPGRHQPSATSQKLQQHPSRMPQQSPNSTDTPQIVHTSSLKGNLPFRGLGLACLRRDILLLRWWGTSNKLREDQGRHAQSRLGLPVPRASWAPNFMALRDWWPTGCDRTASSPQHKEACGLRDPSETTGLDLLINHINNPQYSGPQTAWRFEPTSS